MASPLGQLHPGAWVDPPCPVHQDRPGQIGPGARGCTIGADGQGSPLVAHEQLDRAAVRMAVNPDGENGRWKGKTLPGEIRKGLETA